MTICKSLGIAPLLISLCMLSACSVDKLEARLQADPQCKAVLNPKTGALMPCPGNDREFYKAIPTLNATASKPAQETSLATSPTAQASGSKTISAPVECKPQLHQKSGSLMPCPAP